MKSNLTVAAGILAVVLIAAFVNTNRAAVHDMGTPTESVGVHGDLRVSYEMITRSTGSSAELTTPITDQPCAAIEFRDRYIVLKYKAGGGRILPIADTRNIRWEGK